jgi:UDP-N-acetylglucosamine--N-acetylmuramyl-(pentapeptide) pyrophosphoryl-undecaprenol N-acetylglucosamine transferase
MVQAGAASMFADAEIDGPAFGDEIVKLLTSVQDRESMAASAASLARPMAAHAVAEVAVEAATEWMRLFGRGEDVAS